MLEYRIDWTIKESRELEDKINELFTRLLEEKEQGRSGYYLLPDKSRTLIEEIRANLMHSDTVQDAQSVVVIGIGGSSLGAKALDRLLKPITPNAKKMIFLENPDPVEVAQKLKMIDPKKSLFCIISKSGSTIETITLYKIILDTFKLHPISKYAHRIFAVTDRDSVLHRYAKEHGIKSYFIPENVGGRFSVLSAVGMLPLTLAGYESCDILKGASKFLESFFDRQEDHLLKKGLFYANNRHKYPMNVLFAYSSELEDFTKWYVQLWGESLGKIDASGQRVGLTPLGHIGSIDQHSFLQLIMEGPRDKTVSFLKVENFADDIVIPDISLEFIQKSDFVNGHSLAELLNKECDATWESIQSQGVPTDGIVLDSISPQNLGELIIYFELLTSITGAALGVDTYNQPGVELGKRILIEKFH